MAQQQSEAGVSYERVDRSYFEQRGLKRYAGVASLWALGVGAVISGHFSGWNFGLAPGGWGGLLIAAILIAIMYLGLIFCIAEMSPALPHTGAAYSFARTTMGPWGGFVTGLCENVEYVVTPAVVVFFIGSYLGSIFGTGPEFQPVYWIVCYLIFVGLNVAGVELSFKVTLIVTLLALACLIGFWISAFPVLDFNRWALNIGAGPDGAPVELPNGNGPFLPFGIMGALSAMPFAVWLFLAIEQLPLAAEESVDPKRDMPKGIILGMLTLIISAFMILWLNSSVPVTREVTDAATNTTTTLTGAFAVASSGEPLLDGFRAIYGADIAKILAAIAVVGLIASFHTIIFAQGRQIYSLSRAGYFPRWMSITHSTYKTPHVAMIVGALVGLGLMLSIWFYVGADASTGIIGGTLLNMAVFGAMCSYVAQAVSFILLRTQHTHIERPYKSPFGIPGAVVTVVLALITIGFQFADPIYRQGVIGVAIWFAVGIVYFGLFGRRHLVLSPEEEFALTKGVADYKTH
jgi:ethanolamine permease